nr:DUF4136 domain-containing protein [uncultured Mucilaginibacter sp.]
MKKYIYLMLAVTFVSVLSACSSYNYYTAAANKTNLSSYRTFAWAPMKRDSGKQWRPLTEIGNGKLQEAAKTALLQKGLAINEQNPDLLVGYATVTGRGSKITYYYSPMYGGYYGGFGYGWYRPFAYGYYGYGFPNYGGAYAARVPYKEGTIIIDLIDPKTNTLIWRGYGVGELHNPKTTLREIPKVVEGIIKQLNLNPPVATIKA